MKHNLVEVEWNDAHAIGGDTWTDAEEAVELGSAPSPCVSVGFLIVQNEKVITIAGTVSYDGDVLSLVNGVMTIPRGMVRKVRRLK